MEVPLCDEYIQVEQTSKETTKQVYVLCIVRCAARDDALGGHSAESTIGLQPGIQKQIKWEWKKRVKNHEKKKLTRTKRRKYERNLEEQNLKKKKKDDENMKDAAGKYRKKKQKRKKEKTATVCYLWNHWLQQQPHHPQHLQRYIKKK